MTQPTATQRDPYTATHILFPTVSSPRTAHTLFPRAGTRLYDCGSSPPATPLVPLSATPTMFSPFPSLQITVKSSQDQEIAPSSSGILWETASSPSQIRDIPTGFHAYDSRLTRKTLSSSVLDGTNWSRYVQDGKTLSPLMRSLYLLLQSLLAMRQNIHLYFLRTFFLRQSVVC